MKKIIIAIVVIIIAGVAVWGIKQKQIRPLPVGNTSPVKIGAVLSLTGLAAPWGEYAKSGVDLAVQSINASGGVNGRKVEVVIEDDHTDAKTAVSAYQKLVNVDKVEGVIGGVFDFTAQPLISLASTSKIAFISPSNFRIVGGFELNDQSFVMLPDFNKVLGALKSYLSDVKVKKLAVVHFKSVFGNEIANTLNSLMKENGQSAIVNEEYTKIGGNDFRTTIAKLKAAKVDAVFLDMVGDDPHSFLVEAKQLGFKPKFISYNGVTDFFAHGNDKDLLEGVVILNWEVASPQFVSVYKTVYKTEPTKSADKYFDAIYVMAQSVAAVDDTSKVSPYIAKTSFKTPNNTITFTPGHAVETIPVQVNVIKGGVQVPYTK